MRGLMVCPLLPMTRSEAVGCFCASSAAANVHIPSGAARHNMVNKAMVDATLQGTQADTGQLTRRGHWKPSGGGTGNTMMTAYIDDAAQKPLMPHEVQIQPLSRMPHCRSQFCNLHNLHMCFHVAVAGVHVVEAHVSHTKCVRVEVR